MASEQELPLFLGLNDKSITDIPKTVEKQRYMTSVAPKAANPGKWVEMPRMPQWMSEKCIPNSRLRMLVVSGVPKY